MTALFLIAGLILLIAGAEALVRGASRLAATAGLSPLVIGLTVVAYGTSAPEMAVSTLAGLSGRGDIAVGNVVGSNIFNVLFILGASAAICPLKVSLQLVRLDVPLMIAACLLALILGWNGRIERLEGGFLLAGGAVYTFFLLLQSRRAQHDRATETTHTAAARPRNKAAMYAANFGWIFLGLGLLILGSRWLVNGATAAARELGLSELIIGLTIVAAGTSLPEAATSIVAAARGQRDIAVGNVVGSNIFNVLFVMGSAAVCTPGGLSVSTAALAFDMPVMLAVAVACLPIFFTGLEIARWEGILFLGYYGAYLLYLILAALRHDSLPLFNFAMLGFVIPLTAVTLTLVTLRTLRR
jgi:cation:H+ antiporter